MTEKEKSSNITDNDTERLLDIVAKYSDDIQAKKINAAACVGNGIAWMKITEEFNTNSTNPRECKFLNQTYDGLVKKFRQKLLSSRSRSIAIGGGDDFPPLTSIEEKLSQILKLNNDKVKNNVDSDLTSDASAVNESGAEQTKTDVSPFVPVKLSSLTVSPFYSDSEEVRSVTVSNDEEECLDMSASQLDEKDSQKWISASITRKKKYVVRSAKREKKTEKTRKNYKLSELKLSLAQMQIEDKIMERNENKRLFDLKIDYYRQDEYMKAQEVETKRKIDKLTIKSLELDIRIKEIELKLKEKELLK